MQRDPRHKDAGHLAFIGQCPCVVCRAKTYTEEAAHIRMKYPAIAKPMTGKATKPHDWFTVPLCGQHHRDQHAMGEKEFWDEAGINPIEKALALWAVSGNIEAAEAIIKAR
jgi:hypothetical protein